MYWQALFHTNLYTIHVHFPCTHHGGIQGEWRYSSSLLLTLALD